MFDSDFTEKLKEKLKKLKRKDPKTFNSLQKKIFQIINCDLESINHFKNLKKPLNHLKRVHIGSFVLTFQLQKDIIIFEDFAHHDDAY